MDVWRNPLPEGVQFAGRTNDGFRLNLSMPLDDNGLMLLRCPSEQDH